MLRNIRVCLLIAGVMVSLGSVCSAQENSPGAQEEWNPPSAGPITAWTAPLCEKGKLVVQPFFFYSNTRGEFDSDGYYHALPKGDQEYQYLQQLCVHYGVTNRLEIDASTAYQENYAKQGGISSNSSGFGDSSLVFRYCLHEEDDKSPHVTGLFQIKAPTGQYQHAEVEKLGTDLTGSGSWDYGLGLILTKKVKPFIFHVWQLFQLRFRGGILFTQEGVQPDA